MTTADPFPPIRWDIDLHLDEPGTDPTVRWRDFLVTVDAGQDAEPLAVVSSHDGEVQTRLRPLRIRFDHDILTIVGVLLTLAPDGELVPTETLASLSLRPAAARSGPVPFTSSTWPPGPAA